jgi:hypothetical protein
MEVCGWTMKQDLRAIRARYKQNHACLVSRRPSENWRNRLVCLGAAQAHTARELRIPWLLNNINNVL